MRINEIRIDRFGVWRDVTLNTPGLCVIYGPNEAGKTTLWKFIRGVLFGYPENSPSQQCAGELEAEYQGALWRIRRESPPFPSGTLQVERDGKTVSGTALDSLIQGVSEDVFNRVFSVGLREIQELSTLEEGAVGDYIYSLTLGPDGRKLLAALKEWQEAKGRSKNSPVRTRLMQSLEQQRSGLRQYIAKTSSQRDLYSEAKQLRDLIKDIKSRREDLARQIRGHRLLKLCFDPWRRYRSASRDLEGLPKLTNFPNGGLEQLKLLDQRYAVADRRAQQARSEYERLGKEFANAGIAQETTQHLSTIQFLVDERRNIGKIRDRGREILKQVDRLEGELRGKLESLGTSWSQRRLEEFDLSATNYFRVVKLARTLSGSFRRRTSIARRHARLERRLLSDRAILEDHREAIGGLTIEQGLQKARARLEEMQKLCEVKVQEQALVQRQIGIDEQRERIEARLFLPGWVYLFLGTLGVSGMLLAVAGVLKGIELGWLVGMIYLLLGITCLGVTWGLKRLFETSIREESVVLANLSDENRARLHDVRTDLLRMLRPEKDFQPDPHANEITLIKQAAERVARLERLVEIEQSFERMNGRLATLKSLLQRSEKDVGSSRRSWQELMTELKLPVETEVQQGLAAWKVLVECGELARQKRDLLREADGLRFQIQNYEERVRELARLILPTLPESATVEAILAGWEIELGKRSQARTLRRGLKEKLKGARKEFRSAVRARRELDVQRDSWIAQGGARTRKEFEELSELSLRHQELQRSIEISRAEMERLMAGEAELALSEHDFEKFDPKQNEEHLELMQLEADDLANDQLQLESKLTRCEQEIVRLETDPEPGRMREEIFKTREHLRQLDLEDRALDVAGEALQELRTRFERNCQPVTLAAASRLLERMTHGRYRNIWTPISDRQLCVDNQAGEAQKVEMLSTGTREQLFIALRLALAEHMGGKLPMILDDVLVNFDQERASALASVLIDYVSRGNQVILFTCHRHLAEIFQRQGVEPIWLPGRTIGEERMVG